MKFASYTKYQPLAVLLFLFASIGGIIWLGVLPLERSLQNKMRAIEEFHAGRENRERQVQRLPELQNQYDAILANEQDLNVLITEDKVVDFVKTVESVAESLNIKLSITSKDGGKVSESKKTPAKAKPVSSKSANGEDESVPVKETPAGIMDRLPYDHYLSLSISAEGSYQDVVAFLRKLETLPFGLDVVRMEVKKKAAEEASSPVRPAAPSNPFAILGDSSEVLPVQPAPEVIEAEGILEAVFDTIIYVKKTGV